MSKTPKHLNPDMKNEELCHADAILKVYRESKRMPVDELLSAHGAYIQGVYEKLGVEDG